MPLRRLASAAIGLLAAIAAANDVARAQTPVDLELVLAVDASSSVSGPEFDLQMQGLATAFRDPDVRTAIRQAGPQGIAVALAQWSSPGHQVVVVDWTAVADDASAESLAARLESSRRLILGETALDGALAFATALLENNGFAGRRRVIDVSGDGQANWGPDPDSARDRAVAAGITINALAVVNEQAHLDDYYRAHVIGGEGAFVLAAADYADFARAMRLKLLRELARDVVSSPREAREQTATLRAEE
jgi:hypothetical protein